MAQERRHCVGKEDFQRSTVFANKQKIHLYTNKYTATKCKTYHGAQLQILTDQRSPSVMQHAVTEEKMLNTFCSGRGSNQDLLRGSQTLYRVAIQAGLYRKAVQVCIIPNITTYPPPF